MICPYPNIVPPPLIIHKTDSEDVHKIVHENYFTKFYLFFLALPNSTDLARCPHVNVACVSLRL